MTLTFDDVEIIDDDLGDEDLAGDFFGGPVLTAAPWRNNSHMIADLARGGLYLRPEQEIWDLTHNSGKWWNDWRPQRLVTNDLDHVRFPDLDHHWDIRDLPVPDGTPVSGPDVLCVDLPYVCASLDTEILTERGWLRWAEVTTNDTALTFNMETGQSEWQPVLDVQVFDAGDHLISIEGNSHSSLTTPYHRWPVRGKRRVLPYEWDTTERFRVDSCVPIAAPSADRPEVAKHTDALVEAVAWFWTEGHIYRDRAGDQTDYCNIVQAHAADDRCDLIRSALTRLFGPAVDAFPRTGRSTDGIPRWREARDEHKAVFFLSTDAGRIVQQYAPGRVPTRDFLLSLTPAQLDLFIARSMAADGHVSVQGARTLGQKDKDAAEAFQFAAILAGYATSIRPADHPLGYQMWTVRLRARRHFKPSRLRHTTVPVEPGTKVWCPTLPNQTWLARRNGTVYFTGNCVGGRKTSTVQEFNENYGLVDVPFTPAATTELLCAGLASAARVARVRNVGARARRLGTWHEGGLILFKCKNYVSSATLQPTVKDVMAYADTIPGLAFVDWFLHLTKPMAQPKKRGKNKDIESAQGHGRSNCSHLLVYRRVA